MTIRERLIASFFIITTLPLGLMSIATNLILSNQTSILENSYQSESSISSFITDPIHFLYSMMMVDYTNVVQIADTNPDRFYNSSFLNTLNHSLEDRDSFLVVRRKDHDYFVGNEDLYAQLESLPGFSNYQYGSSSTISVNQSIPCLIKEKDFYFSDHTQGQVFLITDLTQITPAWEDSITQLVVSLILAVMVTALLLVFWINNSIVKPLNILRIATMNIGAGNLDEPIRATSTDEIGQLCQDFEEMRVRLKDMIEERIVYEEDTREMISSMAHDLQTPLTSIKGYTEGILDGVANTPTKQEKYLRTIYAKASDMSYLVDELSVFAKVEQNNLPYHFIPINLHNYFNDCIDEFLLDLETTNITLQFDNQVSPETMVYADPEQIKRVIQNLIGNSRKYLDKPKGWILIEITDVPVPEPTPPLYRQVNKDGSLSDPEEDLQPADSFVQIKIQDNGSGIPEKDLPYIFHRFFRGDASRNSSKRGSGLGLAIVEKIINEHGGQVWAQSIPGKGTSILFTLKKISK